MDDDSNKSYCLIDTECPLCGTSMLQEHAHLKCKNCGYRSACCW